MISEHGCDVLYPCLYVLYGVCKAGLGMCTCSTDASEDRVSLSQRNPPLICSVYYLDSCIDIPNCLSQVSRPLEGLLYLFLLSMLISLSLFHRIPR